MAMIQYYAEEMYSLCLLLKRYFQIICVQLQKEFHHIQNKGDELRGHEPMDHHQNQLGKESLLEVCVACFVCASEMTLRIGSICRNI